MNRPVGGGPAFRPGSLSVQDPTLVFKRDAAFDDGGAQGPVYDPTRRGDEHVKRAANEDWKAY